ncbi:MAG: hypothetical protein HY288_15890, partial [Planctomycetia bacterium]|nr:hypothetical protein [Planctomycetia bacterium]
GGMFSVPDVPQRESRTFQAFAVQDDLKLTPKKTTVNAGSAKAGAAEPAAKATAKQPAAAAKNSPAKSAVPAKENLAQPAAPRANAAAGASGKSAPKTSVIDLQLAPDADPEVAWHDYFSAHPELKPEAVRETVRQLMHQRQFAQVIGLLRAALRDGLPQPWMYEAMGLAMQAGGSSKREIERALMSAVDFGESTEDLMYVAQYMARSGLEIRALKVFHQVAMVEPLRPEPYLFGLQLAQRLNDLEGIKWSSLGILKQAWPKDKNDVVQNASRAAAATLEQLKAEKRLTEAVEFQAQLDQAKVRDCLVKVTWTGEADVDLLVEEPAGTMCTFRNPRTTAGGVMLGDVASREGRGSPDGLSETYVCPEAFNGTYRVLLRRVWGKITAGKVTVDVYSHYGTKDQKHLRQQIPLGDQDALVVFDLQDGRRKEPLAEQQLANAAAGQVAVNQAILAQQINNLPGSQSAGVNLSASRQAAFGFPFIQQSVGYQPIIIALPVGARMTASGVVSADRRYVRVSPIPFFSQIASVTTFNLQQGVTGTQPGTTGGGGVGSGNGGGGFGGGGGQQQNNGR